MPDGLLPAGASRLHGSPVLNLANIVSFARICAVPLAIWLVLREQLGAAFVVFTMAGLSDALDGWLARRYGGSALGAMLDPVADKALLISMFVTLAAVGVLPDWLAILVVFRDVVILGGAVLLWLTGTLTRVRPLFISKVNTALQLLLVGAALLISGFGLHLPAVMQALTIVVATSTLVSGAAYVVRTTR